MNKHSVVARLSLLLVSLFSSIDIGRASWISVKDKEEASISISSDPGRAVCYIGDTYYTSLDAALDAASSNSIKDTIYVIPNLGTAVNITKSHTINSGDSLVLPYEGETFFNENAHGTFASGNNYYFADQDATCVSTYRKTQVILSATLNVYGTLNIGGVIGAPKKGVTGQTAGAYSEITMKDGSKLKCLGGEINCYGYIKRYSSGNGSSDPLITIENNGTRAGALLTPLVVYDFKGGSYTLAAYNAHNLSPFYVFDFPNVQVKTKVDQKSYWKCRTCLYISSTNMYVPIDGLYFIAPSSDTTVNQILVQNSAKQEGSISVEYVPAKNGYTSSCTSIEEGSIVVKADGTKTTIAIESGEVDVGSIKFTLDASEFTSLLKQEITIDSSNFFLPISYRLSMVVKSGSTLNSSKKVKFMSGSSALVESGGTLNVSAPLAIYDEGFTDYGTGISPSEDVTYPTKKSDGADLEAASLINNGTISVTSDGAIGGLISTTANDSSATLKYNTESYMVDSPEVQKFLGDIDTYNYSKNATGMLSSDGDTFGDHNIVRGDYYYSLHNEVKAMFGWYSPITIALVDGSSKQTLEAGSIQVKAVVDSSYFDGDYSLSWSLSDGTSLGSENTVTLSNTTTSEKTVTVVAKAGTCSVSREFQIPAVKVWTGAIKTFVVNTYEGDTDTTVAYSSTSTSSGVTTTKYVSRLDKNNEYTWRLEAVMDPEDSEPYPGTTIKYTWKISSNGNIESDRKGHIVLKKAKNGQAVETIGATSGKINCTAESTECSIAYVTILKKTSSKNFNVELTIKWYITASESQTFYNKYNFKNG